MRASSVNPRAMRARFVGVGGAFEPQLGNSALWVPEFYGENLLIDCGFTTYARLCELGLENSVDAILVTHLHADHVGSLTNLIFSSWFRRNQRKMKIYDPGGALSEELRDFLALQLRDIARFVDWVPLESSSPIRVINTFGDHVPGMPTVGYILQTGDGVLVFSGDTGKPERIFEGIEQTCLHPDLVLHEMTYETGVSAHTHFEALHPWLERYQVVGYHCSPATKPEGCKVQHASELQLVLT